MAKGERLSLAPSRILKISRPLSPSLRTEIKLQGEAISQATSPRSPNSAIEQSFPVAQKNRRLADPQAELGPGFTSC